MIIFFSIAYHTLIKEFFSDTEQNQEQYEQWYTSDESSDDEEWNSDNEKSI